MVGCVCAEEDTNIKWTWLSEVGSPWFTVTKSTWSYRNYFAVFISESQGAPKRCECGFWMELKSHPAPDKYDDALRRQTLSLISQVCPAPVNDLPPSYSQLRPSHSVRFAEIHKDGICPSYVLIWNTLLYALILMISWNTCGSIS